MKVSNRVLYLFIGIIFLSSCNQQPDNISEQWQADEMLLHLSELRKEVALLRKDVVSLQESVAKIPTGNRREAITSMPLNNQIPFGDENAELAIVEFSDYQCPFCVRHAKQVFPDLKKNFVDTGKVKYFMRNFPLSFHAQARDAAIVAECAGAQGKQWEVHEYLFENSRQLNSTTFGNVAEAFGLNTMQFEMCRNDKKVADKVDNDMALGQKMGVTGTPKFFIGRIKGDQLIELVPLSGAQPYNAFERVIKSFDKKS